jgi:aspartyl-tRNA(Asn)/glutamyl-tRNA(Gln) amidotransferase subunit B
MNYEAVIGLEVHAQLLTESKIFSASSAAFGGEPNTQTDPVVLGLPGALPVLNKRAVEFAIKMGLATHCEIAKFSQFARKHYFYPDLPKGYQISQYELPICKNGYVQIEVNNTVKKIRLNRIHLEEDAGKSIHDPALAGHETLVDLNRSGVPLIEIVSEPDIRSPEEAYAYLSALKQIVTYLGICDGNMEEGSLRCDANVSVRPVGEKTFGVKTEVKNMNSFRNVERALNYEINRQIAILREGGTIQQETLLWDANANVARTMRSKEEAHDYRYFPDPDLTPVVVEDEYIESIKKQLPELPEAKKLRFISEYQLPEYDAALLTETIELADYYEAVVQHCSDYKLASNWVMSEIIRILNEQKISIVDFPLTPAQIAELLNMVVADKISLKIAKTVYEEMLTNRRSAEAIVAEKGLVQISDSSELTKIIEEILSKNPKQVEEYKGGKDKVLGFFVGQVMRATKGQANPALVNKILKEKLAE